MFCLCKTNTHPNNNTHTWSHTGFDVLPALLVSCRSPIGSLGRLTTILVSHGPPPPVLLLLLPDSDVSTDPPPWMFRFEKLLL